MPFELGPRAASKGYRLAAFDQIGSTNAEAMAHARKGELGPIWLVTTEQTAGRGRRNRPWIATRGNLASSILEVMDTTPLAAATLGFAAGLAAQWALRKLKASATEIATLAAASKRLAVEIRYAQGAGLDPHRARIRLLQVYDGGDCALVIDLDHTGADVL